MKTFKLFICALLTVLPYSGFSQHDTTSGPSIIDVNGIHIGGIYTKAQVIAKWGEPTRYRSNTSEFGVNETYHYYMPPTYDLINVFRFSDNGLFNTFVIRSPGFAIFTKRIEDGIQVGDHFNKVSELTDSLGESQLVQFGQDLYFLPLGDDIVKFEFTSDGIVKRMWFTDSI